jgi:MFS family permease
VYASIFPFIGIARDFFTTMYGLSGTAGSTQVSFYQLASAIGSPLLGGVVDRTGYSIVWLAGACLCFAGVHVVFALTAAIPAAVMMATMGLFYCVLVSSLWPSCPKTVDAARVGLAYGAMTSMQNTLLALTPLATGSILDQFEVPTGCNTNNNPSPRPPNTTTLAPSLVAATTSAAPAAPNATCAPGAVMMQASKSGYQYVEVLFIGLATVAFLLTLVLWSVQRRVGGILHLSGKDAKARQVVLAGELAAAAAADAEPNGMDSNLL